CLGFVFTEELNICCHILFCKISGNYSRTHSKLSFMMSLQCGNTHSGDIIFHVPLPNKSGKQLAFIF
uniref:Uncharacterized protein n=1 Tax=Aegilops tauschii subsp. strangulata TaxID=200361 RepID=A0A453FNV6_AEGTS